MNTNKEIVKDFDGWIVRKKAIHAMPGTAFAHPREIWWCSVGVNIGAEIDVKNENYERPVIVIKVYNKETLLVLPITSLEKNDRFHHKINADKKTVWVKLTQHRVISNKRLIRKIDMLGQTEFDELKKIWKDS